MGIRPEHLASGDPAGAALKGIVRTVEFLGSRSLIRVDVGPVLATAFVAPDSGARVGEPIGLSPKSPDAVSWFDVASGQATGRTA
jgi:ABC-type sugar transport system ATPase subunit